jgi:TonB family protein
MHARFFTFLIAVFTTIASADPIVVAPKPNRSLEAPIPASFKHLHMHQPHVEFLVLVDETGAIKDSIPTSSNHYGLIPAAASHLANIRFEPGTLDGIATPSRHRLIIRFTDPEQRIWQESGQIPMGGNVMDGTERRLFESNIQAYTYGMSEVNTLDSALQLIEGSLVVIEDTKGQPPVGNCTVEFYIDSEGHVRLANILNSDNDSVSLSALASLNRMRFAPPRSSNKPTYVKVRQTFRYANPTP